MRRVLAGSLLALASVLVSAPLFAAEFYRWVDDKGTVHLTDNLHNIPENRRATAKRIQGSAATSSLPVAAPAPNKASVPFEKHGSVVIVKATLNGKAPVKLIVDTGASFTMISSATAKQLEIDANQNPRSIPFQTANGMIQAPLINLDSIAVAGLELKNLTAAVHDALPDPEVAGLLGLNFLTNFRLDIDSEKGLVHLEKKINGPVESIRPARVVRTLTAFYEPPLTARQFMHLLEEKTQPHRERVRFSDGLTGRLGRLLGRNCQNPVSEVTEPGKFLSFREYQGLINSPQVVRILMLNAEQGLADLLLSKSTPAC